MDLENILSLLRSGNTLEALKRLEAEAGGFLVGLVEKHRGELARGVGVERVRASVLDRSAQPLDAPREQRALAVELETGILPEEVHSPSHAVSVSASGEKRVSWS